MDHAEQSPKVPSRGSFDTASLLVVEEVLGHLYAKPPSAECKVETQTSGIIDSQQVVCKSTSSTSLPTADPQNLQVLNSVSVISSEKEVIPVKISENSVVNNIPASPLPTVLSVPVISSCSVKPKKLDANKNSTSSTAQKSRKKRVQKDLNADGMKNGKKARSSNNRHKPQTNKKLKEKSAKNLSSDSDSHGESTSSSSGGADSSSGGATASSGSSDSTDEEERVKQQQELARLKKQQKELRRKVQELKQASHESSQQKVDAQVKKSPMTPKPSPRTINHIKKPVPSPAHSSSAMAISPKSFPQKPKLNLCTEDDANMSVPLDLCVKKQEPMFEVTSSSILSPPYIAMASMAKKQLQAITFSQPAGGKLQSAGPKRRGRRPKALSSSNILPPDMAHQLKQNIVKDFASMGLPQKLWLPPTSNAKNMDANSQKKSINSVSPSKSVLLMPGELSNSISSPRKTFTLDSLLAESNGTLDFRSSPNNIDIPGLTLGDKNTKTKERMRYSNRIKKVEEKGREKDSVAKHESSSATDSEPDNDHSDSEESTLENNAMSIGHKRSYDEDGEDFSSKRRRVIPDEREIRIPLEHGWRRETKIRCFSRSGVRGEITYYSPCGKKLRSYPEVIRYLVKNGITDISRDNFTFSTKVIVGEFLECTSSGTSENYVHLKEHEVVARIHELQSKKSRTGGVQSKKSQQPKLSEQEEQQRLWEQKQLQHQLEQQAEEARRQKEQQRILKQQERFERMEQLRIEREIRAQQLLEEQEMKRQQAAYLREQERERRRQHMMLVRALETRKKQEERERKREEMLYEKRINKEKKMEQRRIELDYLRELKKPVEDMMLKDNVPLPTLNRIPGLKLAGKAFADVLMVFEFLQNFGETLGFDSESLPTLNTLQMALLNMDEKLEEELLSVIHHLLVCAIEDPGVSHCSESATVLGQNLKDADVTNNNVSEVLRLYFIAQDKRNVMCQWLHAKPFLALNSAQKAEILAHICNDLLGSRVLMRKVDSNIENVNVLRKDKWLIEGDLRRLKTVQQRRLLKARQLTYEESKLGVGGTNAIPTDTSSVGSSNTTSKDDQNISDIGLKNSSQCDKDKLDDLDNDNESGNDSDDTQAHGIVSDADDEDLQLSNEELTKKVDKLSKQLTCYSNKLTKALHTIRGCTFGQDRYHRRYWVLPKSGGIFVESLESSELPEYQESILSEQDLDGSSDKAGINGDSVEIKKEIDCSTEGKENCSIDIEMKDLSNFEVKDMSNFETKDLNKLETTALSQMENTDMNEIENTDTSKMETTDTSKLETAEVNKLEMTEISKLETTDMSKLETTDMSNLETRSMSNLETTGISNLETTGMSNLEMTGMSNLETTGVNSLETTGVNSLETTGVNSLETTGMNSLETTGMSNLEMTGMNNLEMTGISKLETMDIHKLEMINMHNQKTTDLGKLETNLGKLDRRNLNKLEMRDLSKFEVRDLSKLEVRDLSKLEVRDLSKLEVRDLSKFEVRDLSKFEMRDLSKLEVRDLSKLEVRDLSKLEVRDLSKLEVRDLSKLEVRDLSKLEVRVLSKLEVNDLSKLEADDLSKLVANDLSKLVANDLSKLVVNDLSKLVVNDLNKLETNNVSKLDTKDWSKVETKDLSKLEAKDLSNHEVKNLSNHDMKDLSNHEAKDLNNHKTKDLSNHEVKKLSNHEAKDLSNHNTKDMNIHEAKNIINQRVKDMKNHEINSLNNLEANSLSNLETNSLSNLEASLSRVMDICKQKKMSGNEDLVKENIEAADELKNATYVKKETENMEIDKKKENKDSPKNDVYKTKLEIKKELVKEAELSALKEEVKRNIISDNFGKESLIKALTSDMEIVEKINMELEKQSEKKKIKDHNAKNMDQSFLNEALDKKPDVNIFMPKFCDNLGLETCPSLNHTVHNSSERKPLNPSIPGNQNWILHSPFFASLLAGNMLFNGPQIPGRETNGTYFNLPNSDSNNPFGPFLGIGQSGLLSPEQVFKSLSDKPGNQKPWFSILPRMPCDEDSLPKSHCAKNPFNSSLLYTPPNLFVSGNSNSSKSPSQTTHSIPVTSSSGQGQLSNLQMEILNGVPQGFFLHPFLSHQFGPTYQSGLPVNNTSPNPFSSNLSHSGTITDFTLNLGHPPASSTPSSIPTPSATPGPNSQGCGTPTYRDSPSPSFAKKFMIEKLTQEYDKPKPIPFELQKGWWRITDPSQLKDIVNALHHRGIREKMLQKQLQKHFNYGSTSCTQGPDKDTDLEITDIDRKISELPGGVPLANNADQWSRDVALRVDLSILEQIENLEEKIDGASMQVKGWKPPPKLSTEPVSKFIPACELYLQVKCDITDSPRERNPKKSSKKNARKKKAEARKKALEAETAAEKAEGIPSEIKLEEAETDSKQEVVISESTKENSNEKEKASNEEVGKNDDIPILPPGKINPVEEAKARLLMVEAAIERRYLKPPLGFNSNDLNRSVSGGSREIYDNGEDEPIPVGLHKWRNSVNLCRSSSQLAMCLNYLENFTAWDKSIMRASCQFCHSGENEEMLLLCDGCDKGYHTYCFKPKMEKIPDGDWYCYECLNKATGDNVCVICGKKGKLIECALCPKCFHINCLEPPLAKIPKGKWFCSGCSHSRPKKSSKKSSSASKDREKDKEKEKEQKESSNCKKTDNEPPSKPKASDRKDKKEKNRNPPNEDLAFCITVIEEMEKHDDSWPFLTPVNTKQFPTYRKVIKKPMDLTTVRSKLDSNQYKSREDFATDVRLIFDNCETFNEDDSPVGQAGHTMRAFFDTRWAELCST